MTTTIDTPPANVPDINDPTTFAARAAAWVAWQKIAFPQVEAVRDETEEAQTAALAAAGYAGAWSGLSGALAIPASVYHDDALWFLLEDLADVTAKEPGVDAEWERIATGYSGGTYTGDVSYLAAMLTPPVTLTGTTPALDPSDGISRLWTLTANSTPTDSLANGAHMILGIDDGSSYTVTWPTITWLTAGAVAPTLAATGYTFVLLFKMGSTLYGAKIGV